MSNTNISDAIQLPKLYWLVEGEGQVAEIAKHYAGQRAFVNGKAEEFCRKHGASSFSRDAVTHEIVGCTFAGPVPSGWKSIGGTGKRGGTQLFAPKQGTEARREMLELPIMDFNVSDIADALGIPSIIEFEYEDGRPGGGATISLPGYECGFAYPSLEGPFLFWTADYKAAIQMAEKWAAENGLNVCDIDAPAGFEGCREIIKEEWDLVLAKHAFDAAMQTATKVAANA